MIRNMIGINIRMLYAGLFRRYRRGKKLKPVTLVLIALLTVYVFGALFFTVGALFYQLCDVFFSLGIGWFYFTLAGLMIFALCFIGSFFMVQTQLYNARDNELLLALPIKPSAILAGRLSALLIMEYLFEIIILLPVFVVLIISGNISHMSAAGIILFFLSGILLPLPALAVGCLFGWIVAQITSRMRRKNILTMVMTLLFLFAYLWFYSKMTSYMSVLIERGTEIAQAVQRSVFPAYHLGLAAARGSFVSFIIFALCALVPFIIMCALLSHSFVKVATTNRGAKKIVYREKTLRASGAGKAFFIKELRRYFTTPMYILNSSLGAIFMLGLAGVLIIRPSIVIDVLSQLTFPETGIVQGVLAAMAITCLAAFNYVSAPTISLEGSRQWIIKCLPVSAKTVLLSKLAPHLLVCGVPTVIAGLACVFCLPSVTPRETLLMFILPLSATLLTGTLGLTLNLIFPRFDWLNEMQPIKQGVSSMLTMFSSMGVIAALALLYTLLCHKFLSLSLYLWVCAAVFLILSAVLYLRLMTAGVRRFEAIDA